MASHRSTRWLALAASLGVVVLLAACTSAPTGSIGVTPSPGSASVAPDGTAVAAATVILQATRLGDPDTIAALEGIRLTPAGTAAAGAILKAGASGDALWAATFVYASGSGDPALLRPLAVDATASPSVRAMAAAGLVGGGDIAGFDPLIAALAGSDDMDGAEPAGKVWEFASDVLERYTHRGVGPALTASDAERTAIQGQWQQWFTTNKALLHFDAAARLWAAS